MKRKTKIILSVLLLAPILLLSGCGCKKPSAKQYSLDLEVWGLFDDSDAYSEIFENYKKINPNIENIIYKKLSPDTYQKELLDALASGKGPDIFLAQNSWTPSFADKMTPAPAELINEQQLRSQFPDVVVDDFLQDGKIYALPLSVDSLALYYNKDLFNAAGITSPPTTWEEFLADAKRLTKIDNFGNIIQSGAAMGTAYNINRSTDILNLLMLQNGLSIVDRQNKSTDFNSEKGISAANSYVQFARSSYTWNPRMHYSIDAFSEGNLAMMLNYSWQIPVLKSKSPKLNFGVSAVPQFQNAATKIGYANYWGFGVSKNQQIKMSQSAENTTPVSDATRNSEAWKLIAYMAMRPVVSPTAAASSVVSGSGVPADFDPAKEYLTKTQKPAARRDLINEQKNDPNIGVFALGNLYAKSWYQTNPRDIESIFAEAIELIVSGQVSTEDALRTAATRINGLK